MTVATACSSSAKAFAQGARLLELGIADAVVVGGVDSLCGSVLFGFQFAGSWCRAEPCRPFDAARSGISIGEAAAFALLERDGRRSPVVRLRRVERRASHVDAASVGTRRAPGDDRGAATRRPSTRATSTTSTCTARPVSRTTRSRRRPLPKCSPRARTRSSTKGWTGHTLGAAGALEAVITLLSLESGLMPGNLNSRQLDAACGPQVRLGNARGTVRHAMSNSFGFGGSNCVLLFAAAAAHEPAGEHGAAVREWRGAVGAAPAGMGTRAREILAGREPAPLRAGTATRARTAAAHRAAPCAGYRGGGAGSGAGGLQIRADLPPASLPCVFSSMHGDLAITDYMCATWRRRRRWYRRRASTTRCTTPPRVTGPSPPNARVLTPSLSAGEHSFGAGLLETCVQALSAAREHPAGGLRHRRARTARRGGAQQASACRRR